MRELRSDVKPFDAYLYLDAAAAALDLSVPPEQRDAVAANLARLHGLAQYVAQFDSSAQQSDSGASTRD